MGDAGNSNYLCFPAPTGQLCSPMAVSPASLNTPRGSIVSMRSRQHSPMNLDPTAASVTATVTQTSAVVSSTTSDLVQDLSEFSATFTIQIPPPPTSAHPLRTVLPSYDEAFDFAPYQQGLEAASAGTFMLS